MCRLQSALSGLSRTSAKFRAVLPVLSMASMSTLIQVDTSSIGARSHGYTGQEESRKTIPRASSHQTSGLRTYWQEG